MLTLRTVFLRLTKGDSERDGAYALLKKQFQSLRFYRRCNSQKIPLLFKEG